ncbi:glycosyltransferase [Pleurocapsa sp. PCC 7327]|uniref:glycosyltransferase n=1 Tax=Pleurocapsa sp. PCC 7327 TaxID=118163 RepID=UPI0002E6D39C|nr:glycosyltransferase [Pleurocapsa sp. PCC 7327]
MNYSPTIGACSCCGHTKFTFSTVLWQSLIDEWRLANYEVEYINRQQGLKCENCQSSLRTMALAIAIMKCFGYEGLFQDFVLTEQAQKLKVLEINEAGQLTRYLAKIPGHVLTSYPEVNMIQMPFQDGSFDLVVHSDTLEHVKYPIKALSECYRVLKPGKFLAFTIPMVVDRLTSSREGLSPSYHAGAEDINSVLVYTEYGGDAWKHVIKAGFNECRIFSLEYPSAQVLVGVKLVSAYIDNVDEQLRVFETTLLSQRQALQAQLKQAQDRIELLRDNERRSHSQQQQTQVELEQARSQLQQTQTESKQAQLQLQLQLQQTQVELEQARSQLQQTQVNLEQMRSQLQRTRIQLEQSQTTVRAMQTSKFWQLRSRWFALRHALGIVDDDRPLLKSIFSQKKHANKAKTEAVNSAGSDSLTTVAPKLENAQPSVEALAEIPQTDDPNYQKWLNKNYPTKATLGKMAEVVEIFAYKPIISLVMPVYNTPERYLREAIESVLNQVYPYWELCIADDASKDNRVREILEEYSAKDSRIKVVFRTENGHISRCSNSALELASGDFIALFDHDDLLAPHALYEVALLLNKHPEADMIYSDEDKIDDSGKLQEPFFKPDWCPDTFLSGMYTCHLGVYRRELVNAIGGFRPGYDGSQDYDLVLRLTEKTTNIFHIAKTLYHWRIHPQSAASVEDVKPYAVVAAEKALADALKRRGEPGKVIRAKHLVGKYAIRYEITDYQLVSIIIPTKDLGETLDRCLTSIFAKSIYPNYEVILIDNGSQEEYTAKVIAKWQEKETNRFSCYRLDVPFNFSKINNYAVERAKGDYLLFLNNDIEVITPDWIEAMVEQAQRPSIGAVGVLLLYPDNTVQHAGVVLGLGGVAGHSHKYYSANSSGYFDRLLTINNYSAVTAACLMCRRKVFEAVGGFEEQLAVAFNDVDLCLKILEKGYRNIYLPHVRLYHYESKSRGYEDTPQKQVRFVQEIDYMKEKWQRLIECDPCYNPNLTRNCEDFSIDV